MSEKKNRPDWDDGRTVADMSVLDGGKGARQPEPDLPYTPRERRWAVLGALKATLLIAGAFLLGLALVIALLLWIWQ